MQHRVLALIMISLVSAGCTTAELPASNPSHAAPDRYPWRVVEDNVSLTFAAGPPGKTVNLGTGGTAITSGGGPVYVHVDWVPVSPATANLTFQWSLFKNKQVSPLGTTAQDKAFNWSLMTDNEEYFFGFSATSGATVEQTVHVTFEGRVDKPS